jgi:hypothetical protein
VSVYLFFLQASTNIAEQFRETIFCARISKIAVAYSHDFLGGTMAPSALRIIVFSDFSEVILKTMK